MSADGLPVALPPLPTAPVQRRARPGARHPGAAQRRARGPSGHAYLFSGPRGTGKTSTARILAKALNCEHLQDGEPDGTCESCLAIDAGTSYDVQELDAASNNGVNDVRELIGRVSLGSPGRTKVYILDEVHMLTAQASAALLKTLEEPPPHVVFVLATTDPQKVLPTIRSRTQHFDFHLLSVEELTEHWPGDPRRRARPARGRDSLRGGPGQGVGPGSRSPR
ncbi:MAG: AAA family ATPase [Acidimicrobiales bacterium]